MPTHSFQPDGSVVINFPENGTTITLPPTTNFQMDPSASDWHEYAVTATFDENYTITPGGQAFDANVTLEDVQLALLQQSAPEWRDAFTTTGISPDNPVATTGSFTDTFGPGQVTHVVSDDGLVIINQTLPGHPFHPGVVVRTVVENNGAFDVISYGLGNTSFEGAFGAVTAFANQGFGMVLFSDASTIWSQSVVNSHFREGTECFGAGTPVDMWPLDKSLKPGPDGIYDQEAVSAKIWKKSIELIEVGDTVVSFDDKGNMVPGYVPRTFQNEVKILLNFFGTRVTPGHVYYRADSKKASKFETLIDILRDDGVIQKQDGTLIRAATNVPVGDPRDGFVKASTGTRRADGTLNEQDQGRIRLGTRFIVGEGKQRKHWSVADVIEHAGGVVGDDEMIRIGDGPPMAFHWEFGDTLPKPEDFVLEASGTSLEDIYKAAEWEGQQPQMPAPMVMDGGPIQPLPHKALNAMPRNEPLSFTPTSAANHRQALNRKQRKAMEAKQRKAGKVKRVMS